MMTRTQITLPKNLDQQIAFIAQQRNQPKAQVIRDLLQEQVARYQAEHRQTTADALMLLVKLGEELRLKGPKDLSMRLDDYLYGKD